MRASALAISSAVLAVGLGTPPLLFAQEAPPEGPAVATDAAPAEEEVPIVEEEGSAPPVGDEASAEPDTPEPETYVAAQQAAGSVSVTIRDFLFSPNSIQIGVGESVTWSNAGQENHTATGSGFDTGTLGPGGSASHTFTAAGTFSYVCNFHADMTGTVQVLADSGTDPGGTPGPGEAPPAGDPAETSSTDPTAAPGSEAAAALHPNAGSGLPATGEPEGALILLAIGLVGCGLLARATARLREREVLHLTDRADRAWSPRSGDMGRLSGGGTGW